MPIDFPNNPSAGQTYSFNNQEWIYNGVAWDKLFVEISGGTGATGPQGNTGATGATGATAGLDIIVSVLEST